VDYPRRYALCDYDAFTCITRLHRGLYHTGKNPWKKTNLKTNLLIGINRTHQQGTELFYRCSQDNTTWVVSRCAICNANTNNREPSIVTLIVSKRCLDRVYIDLIDFTSQPKDGYKYILQVKDHFSRMV
jgi:hypothetical protein